LHEIFFDQALETAKGLDDYLSKHGKPKGPLHGLPVSLKDQFHVKGVDTSMGYVGWIGTFEGKKGTGKEKVFESLMVEELRQLGAVLYVKTSVPHTLMCGETVNNIVGYTYNPTNRNLSSGGSSGGEGALISLGGSPVGFGTDIGGSIRIPAAFCGLYGLRPSTGRMPYEGMANSWDGAPGVLSVVGPLAPSPGALRLVTKGLLGTQPWLHDPLVHELPWRNEQEEAITKLAKEKKLCFAVMRHDGHVAPHPPVSRAVEETVKLVESLGHKVIEWKPPAHGELYSAVADCWNFDGGADGRKAFDLSGETPAPQVLLEERPQFNASQIMDTMVHKRALQKKYMEYWNSTEQSTGTGRPVDAVISPLAPFAAARPQGYTHYGYSIWVNLLDYTSVVVPVTKVNKTIDAKDANFKAIDEQDQKTQDTCKSPGCHREVTLLTAADDPEVYDGAHVAVQLVGRRLQEEKMLALASYLAEAKRP